MERLLHYVWKYRLYNASSLMTTDGIRIEVLDPGLPNGDAGPDFFNAKIKVGQTVWAGGVEIHNKTSDWLLHKHDEDRAYDAVILHVTAANDALIYRSNGEAIPQLVLDIPESISRQIEWLLKQDRAVPCLDRLFEIDPMHVSMWMGALLSERLERKMQDIITLLSTYENDWNEVFYIILTRSFGCGLNSDAFEWLARSLPFRCIRKQRNSSSQVEALLFGQAGMLEEELPDHYYHLLQREYKFLRYKFGLQRLDETLFKNLRVRPGNFPHLKLAQLAAIWSMHDTLFSTLLEAHTPGEIKRCFRIKPSDYWFTHYHFRYASVPKEKLMGDSFLNILLINAVVPMLFAYGRKNNRPEYGERAIRLLETIPAEQNSIVRLFTDKGVTVRNAGDTQSLIQLKREYCEKKKCLYCRIGFQLLKRVNAD